MKKTLQIGMSIGILCLQAHLAMAKGPEKSIVYPTGAFPDDVVNVQAAVAKGGEVELEATDASGKPAAFNFGPADSTGGSVSLTVDVNLHGARSRAGITRISGGFIPIVPFGAIHFTVAGLQFDEPAEAAIFVIESSGGSITDNIVNHVIGIDYGDGITEGFGIGVNPSGRPYSAVSGPMLIARNIINGVQALQGYGILAASLDAEVIIDENKVTDINFNGILVGGISQNATIINNYVVTGQPQDPNFTAGNGILVGHARGGHFFVIGNEVKCINAYADGIAFIASADLPVDGGLVSDNDVTMHGSYYGGISLYDTVSHIMVARNTIRGDASSALQVGIAVSEDPATAVGNEFVSNAVNGLRPTVADIFLDINSGNTVLCRQEGSLVDNGSGTQREMGCAWRVR